MIFGQWLTDYQSGVDSMLAIFNFAINKFDYEAIAGANSILGPIFFFSFAGTMMVISTTTSN